MRVDHWPARGAAVTTILRWSIAVPFQDRPFCYACNNRLAYYRATVTAQSEPHDLTVWRYYCERCTRAVLDRVPTSTGDTIPDHCGSPCCQGSGVHLVPDPGTAAAILAHSCPAHHARLLLKDNGIEEAADNATADPGASPGPGGPSGQEGPGGSP